jgi:RNA polymerase sigma factor (sigma-70 family)
VPLAVPLQPLTVRSATRLLALPTRSPVQELEEIYDEHVWRVYAFFAYRLGDRDAAEDLTQATFERAVRAFRRYDARKGSHRTWLMAIANNLLIDHFRRHASHPTRPLEQEDLDGVPAGADPETSLGLDLELASALAILSDREREIVALRYGSDLTGRQIAELKGMSLANVQQILSRSLRQMRVALEESHAKLSER